MSSNGRGQGGRGLGAAGVGRTQAAACRNRSLCTARARWYADWVTYRDAITDSSANREASVVPRGRPASAKPRRHRSLSTTATRVRLPPPAIPMKGLPPRHPRLNLQVRLVAGTSGWWRSAAPSQPDLSQRTRCCPARCTAPGPAASSLRGARRPDRWQGGLHLGQGAVPASHHPELGKPFVALPLRGRDAEPCDRANQDRIPSATRHVSTREIDPATAEGPRPASVLPAPVARAWSRHPPLRTSACRPRSRWRSRTGEASQSLD